MLNRPEEYTHLDDNDPAAPWNTDPAYGGPTDRGAMRRSWEAAQHRAALHVVQDDGPARDEDVPPAASAEEFGLPNTPAGDAAPVHIAARPYVWCEPASIPRRDRLYGSHLFRGLCSATIAPGGTGKSSLVIAESLSMVTRRPLLGARLGDRPLRAWLWNLEDPYDELQRRIQAACLHHDISAEDIGGRLFVNGREDALVIARGAPSGAVLIEPVVDALIAEIIARQIDVLLVDPFVSCHSVSENDNGAIDAVTKAWGRVAGAGNCAVELVHHARKLGDNEVTAESARGAIAMVAACRDVRVLNRMAKDEADRAGVENHRLHFRTYSDKANLAPPSDKSDWYRLVSVDLGNGAAGESDHVQAVDRWEWPDALNGLAARDLLAVQQRVAAGEWRKDSRAEQWAGKAVAEVLNLDINSAPVLARVKSLLGTWLQTGALKVVRRADEQRKERDFIEVGQWATPLE